MSDRGRYLYAVCRGLDPSALAGVAAVGREPLEVVEALDLQGVVSTVDLHGSDERGPGSTLRQPDRFGETARRHADVVRACGRHAPTAPLRRNTIDLDDWSVRRRLELWYDALAAALDRVARRQEWRVTVYASGRARQPVTVVEPVAIGGRGSRRHRKAAQVRRTAEARQVAAVQEVDRMLRDVAVATRRLGARGPQLTGVEATMVLNGAYLVDERSAAEFTARVAGLVATFPEVSIACGGPSPPYSFATVEEP